MPKKDDNMPSKEPQAQPTETDITIEPATEEAYTPIDTDNNNTAENSDNTINTPETYASPDTIYNIITGKEEENIEPTATTQINLTTTPNETAAYTETDQTPPDIPKYTGTFTAPDTQKALIIDQIYPHAATVGGTSSYNLLDKINSLDKIYKTTMDNHEIYTEHLDRTEVTLLDTINYIIKLNEEEPTEIYTLKLAEEMYNDGTITKIDKETIRTLNAYLNILKEAELLEAEGGFNNVYNDITTETIKKTGLFDTEEFQKDYNNNTLEINDKIYTLNPVKHDLLKSAYKEALKSGIDDIPTSQANVLLIDCLEKKTDEFKRNTQIAYI